MLIRKSSLSFLLGALAIVFLGSILILWNHSGSFTTDDLRQHWEEWTVKKPSLVPITDANDEVHILPVYDAPTGEGDGLPFPSHEPRPIGLSSQFLNTRLRTFLSLPVESYVDALKHNLESCPRDIHDRQVNPDQLNSEREFWAGIEEIDIKRRREAMVEYLEVLEAEGKPIIADEVYGSGRGIVMTGGNRDTVARLFVSLRILRGELKSTLPVEIFCFPGEITDSNIKDQLAALGATVHELTTYEKIDTWKNFQIKASSIVASSFSEVLYLDSDNIPLREPSYLFDEPLYLHGGQALFWPDLNREHPENAIWRLFGKNCDRKEWEIDSGQIIINKRGNNGLNLAALHLAEHMQIEHPFYFHLSGGDKDTFRYAFWVLEIPYAVAPRLLSSLGYYRNGRFCGHTMLQYDINLLPSNPSTPHPHPLFVHSNLLKHLTSIPPTEAYKVIRRLSPDIVTEPELDKARLHVYRAPDMCVDVEVVGGGNADEEQMLSVVDEDWETAYGGVYEGWSKMFVEMGGKVGGW